MRYVIALGGNQVGRFGPPRRMVAAALARLAGVVAASPIVDSAPVGPRQRRYANAVTLVDSTLDPPALLAELKRIEYAFGRRRGRRWGTRPIDLDIVLWSSGAWSSAGLTIPHPRFRERDFVLGPLVALAPDWRDPITGRTMRQLRARLTARRSTAPD